MYDLIDQCAISFLYISLYTAIDHSILNKNCMCIYIYIGRVKWRHHQKETHVATHLPPAKGKKMGSTSKAGRYQSRRRKPAAGSYFNGSTPL